VFPPNVVEGCAPNPAEGVSAIDERKINERSLHQGCILTHLRIQFLLQAVEGHHQTSPPSDQAELLAGSAGFVGFVGQSLRNLSLRQNRTWRAVYLTTKAADRSFF
jgi:hypothetical protein